MDMEIVVPHAMLLRMAEELGDLRRPRVLAAAVCCANAELHKASSTGTGAIASIHC